MDSGEVKIEDPAEVAAFRKSARKVHLQALLMGAVGAALFGFVPSLIPGIG